MTTVPLHHALFGAESNFVPYYFQVFKDVARVALKFAMVQWKVFAGVHLKTDLKSGILCTQLIELPIERDLHSQWNTVNHVITIK